MEIQIPANITESDPKKYGEGKGAESRSPENLKGEVETVWGQSPPGLPAMDGGIRCGPEELLNVVVSRVVYPVQNHQLRAQIQLFHPSASQVDDLSGRGEFAVQDEGQANVFDSPFREISLVDISVLNHSAAECQLAHTRHVGHCFGPRFALRRRKIWGQLRHLEPASLGLTWLIRQVFQR